MMWSDFWDALEQWDARCATGELLAGHVKLLTVYMQYPRYLGEA